MNNRSRLVNRLKNHNRKMEFKKIVRTYYPAALPTTTNIMAMYVKGQRRIEALLTSYNVCMKAYERYKERVIQAFIESNEALN